MDFEFSKNQQEIQDQVSNVLRAQCSTSNLRRIMDNEQPYDTNLWKLAGELGWTATRIPEAFGGLGLGYLELALIAEELGSSLAPIPFSSSIYLAAEAILLAGNEAQMSSYLPPLANGSSIGCLATGESNSAFDIARANTRVVDGRISGVKLPVADGDVADIAVVACSDDHGGSLYLVELAQEGITRRVLQTIDPTRSHAVIEFNDAEANLLGTPGKGAYLLHTLWDIGATLFAFEQVGGAQAVLDMGVEYTRNRYAFGRQVASFQAIKHRFADMYATLELARSNAYFSAWALSCSESGNISPQLPLAAATARVSATNAYYQCTKENIQVHGGMGFTWEFDCHLYYRRAQLLAATLGGMSWWQDQLVTRLIEQQASLKHGDKAA